MTKLAGGDWVVEALRAEGVSHVFGIPGVHNLAIYDALLRRPGITHILARHEQGAAFMADGYARSSGRPGVVVVTVRGDPPGTIEYADVALPVTLRVLDNPPTVPVAENVTGPRALGVKVPV